MLNTSKRERIEFNIEQAFRDYDRAKRALTVVCEELVQVAMRQQLPSDKLLERKDEAEIGIESARTALEEAKSEYVAYITNIKFYEF